MISSRQLLINAKSKRTRLWNLYNEWYGNPKNAHVLKKHKRFRNILPENIKQTFYREIRRQTAAIHIAKLKILDEKRFNILSQYFYEKTGIDFEFGRAFIYAFLR